MPCCVITTCRLAYLVTTRCYRSEKALILLWNCQGRFGPHKLYGRQCFDSSRDNATKDGGKGAILGRRRSVTIVTPYSQTFACRTRQKSPKNWATKHFIDIGGSSEHVVWKFHICQLMIHCAALSTLLIASVCSRLVCHSIE